jgi:hypothetical protein
VYGVARPLRARAHAHAAGHAANARSLVGVRM